MIGSAVVVCTRLVLPHILFVIYVNIGIRMFSVITCTDTEIIYTCRSCSCLCYYSYSYSRWEKEFMDCSSGYWLDTCPEYLCCRCLDVHYRLSRVCSFCRVRDGKKNG